MTINSAFLQRARLDLILEMYELAVTLHHTECILIVTSKPSQKLQPFVQFYFQIPLKIGIGVVDYPQYSLISSFVLSSMNAQPLYSPFSSEDIAAGAQAVNRSSGRITFIDKRYIDTHFDISCSSNHSCMGHSYDSG